MHLTSTVVFFLRKIILWPTYNILHVTLQTRKPCNDNSTSKSR